MTACDNSWLHLSFMQTFIVNRSLMSTFLQMLRRHQASNSSRLRGIAQKRECHTLIGAACQRVSMPVMFSVTCVPQRGVAKQRGSSDLRNFEPNGSRSEPPLTLQSASRAVWDPKDCEAAEKRNAQCKTRKCEVTASNLTQSKQQQKTKQGKYTVKHHVLGRIQYIWRSIEDKINDRRGAVQHGEKGGKHHRHKTKLFHINVICGLKTESFVALGASGQICLLCNAPSPLTKMVSLKHKSFFWKREEQKGQPAQSDSKMAQRRMLHSLSYLQIRHRFIFTGNKRTHRHTQVDVLLQIR